MNEIREPVIPGTGLRCDEQFPVGIFFHPISRIPFLAVRRTAFERDESNIWSIVKPASRMWRARTRGWTERGPGCGLRSEECHVCFIVSSDRGRRGVDGRDAVQRPNIAGARLSLSFKIAPLSLVLSQSHPRLRKQPPSVRNPNSVAKRLRRMVWPHLHFVCASTQNILHGAFYLDWENWTCVKYFNAISRGWWKKRDEKKTKNTCTRVYVCIAYNFNGTEPNE